MNPVLELIHHRRSVRDYEARGVDRETRDAILQAAMRAPTAGNMMLYSVIEVKDQALKDRLVETCDHQPFIARAPLVLLFLADYQRWYDCFLVSGVEKLCATAGETMRRPAEGDLFLACCDALIAAQTAVIAAEGLGLGSCYIGDILENYEIHRELFSLPPYAFPICLLCFGYPTQHEKDRELTDRFGEAFVVFENAYCRLDPSDFEAMFAGTRQRRHEAGGEGPPPNPGQLMYTRKFNAPFSREMNRSARAALQAWLRGS
jgi:nitroreductase